MASEQREADERENDQLVTSIWKRLENIAEGNPGRDTEEAILRAIVSDDALQEDVLVAGIRALTIAHRPDITPTGINHLLASLSANQRQSLWAAAILDLVGSYIGKVVTP